MTPSVTSGDSSWAGHMGLGPWGPCGAGWAPARPPSAPTQEGHGACCHGGACCQKDFISPLKKVTCLIAHNWQRALPQLLAGRTRSCGDAVCQPQAPCLVWAGDKEVPAPGSAWQGLPVAMRGRYGGDWQSKPWEEMLWGCGDVGMPACWEGWDAAGCLGMWGASLSWHGHSTVETCRLPWQGGYDSLFLQWNWVTFLYADDLIRSVKYRRKQKWDEWNGKKRGIMTAKESY